MRFIAMMLITGALIAAGCDKKPPEKTVFQPQVEAVKKARGVEGKLKEAGEKQREATESATGTAGY